MPELGFLSVLPPLIALSLAIYTKQVYVSLFVGIWLGQALLVDLHPIASLVASVDAMVTVFEDEGRTKIILLSAMIGAFLTFTQFSGGMKGLVDFAFVIGDTCDALGTGIYIAGVANAGLPAFVLPAMIFVVSAVMSFSTGTSWGTWAIMFPIAIPMIALSGLHAGLTIGAVLGGAIFGDHCSPISDSTIISSMAAATDHIDHVRTQLPYALSVAGVCTVLYLVLGAVL